MFVKVIGSCKPFGRVEAKIASTQCYGNLAMVHTVEEMGAGTSLRVARKRKRGASPDVTSGKKVNHLASHANFIVIGIITYTLLRG